MLWWFSRHKVKPGLLARILTETVRLFQRMPPPRSRTVAVDSTGFARASASPYYQQRAGQRHRARTWLKWSVAVWTDPLVLCGQVADRGPRGDHVEFRPLVAQTWHDCTLRVSWPMAATIPRPTTAGCEKIWASRASFPQSRGGQPVP
jgi:hypothetical protein